MKKISSLLLLTSVLIIAGCTNYGKKATHGHIEFYYKDGISAEQAQRAADLFYSIDSAGNNSKTEKSVQLIKVNDTVCFRMVVDEKKAKEMSDDIFNAIGSIFSDSVFNHAPVKLELTDNTFNTIRIVKYQKIDFGPEPAQQDTTSEVKPVESGTGNQ